jgi:hypothetical protein
VPGERDLAKLLAGLEPELNDGEWVFAEISPDVAAAGHAIVIVREAEGTTAVLPRAVADAEGLPYDFVAAWITLRVHSSLEAVGMTAEFARRLTAAGISANVVAGLRHDHIFVPADRAQEALRALATE